MPAIGSPPSLLPAAQSWRRGTSIPSGMRFQRCACGTNAPVTRPSCAQKKLSESVGSDDLNSSCERLRRGRSGSRKELTVPRGPVLHTSWRPRSTERGVGDAAASPWSQSLRDSAPETPRRLEAPRFEVSSPGPGARTGRRLNMTPESVRSARSTSVRSVRSVRSARSCSNFSIDSRCSSQCSRMSSLDLEEMAAEEGRRRLKELMRQNAKSCYQAINFPDMRHGHHSLKLTVPEGFNLSVSNRADPPGYPKQEDCSSINEKWSKSLRPEMFVKWTRELTVPLGPQLRTSRTRRSLSAREHSSSRKHSVSCKGLPAREREAIARHLQRSKSQALEAPEIVQVKEEMAGHDCRGCAVSPFFTALPVCVLLGRTPGLVQAWSGFVCPAWPRHAPCFLRLGPGLAQLTEEDRQWIQGAENARARAARARTAMQKRSEEAYDKQKQQLFVFGSPSETSKISKVGEEAE
ncbi:unnamed protein product [Durusdinium trenchii]|uniref:Uncharacterized protein n=1 Tax=Durusdinium trenchii TaxID=1381693 RepID=A0ABP0RU45_9DINO